MTTYYVDPTYGIDTAAGTIGAPWKTWARLKTFLESASAQPHTVIILDDITATATIALPSDVTIQGPTWHIRPTITGPTNEAVFSITLQDDITLRNLVIVGGSQFLTFSGDCLRIKILHCKGTGWTDVVTTASQWIDAGGGNRAGSQIAYCEGSDSEYDFFSTAGSYNWLIEYNYVHDLAVNSVGGLTDAFAFHDSIDGNEIVRYNYIKNIWGKAGISFGVDSGSVGEAYGNVVINCRKPITAEGSIIEVLIHGNVVVLNTLPTTGTPLDTPATFGIGTITLDSLTATAEVYNNLVYCTSTAAVITCFKYDCEVQHKNNIAIVTTSTGLFWLFTLASSGFANVLENNIYWSTNGTEGSRFVVDGFAALTLAQVQALSRETGSVFDDPEIRTTPPAHRGDTVTSYGSPANGAGTNLSAVFTTDAFGRAIGATWSIGPVPFPVAEWNEASLVCQVVEEEIECRI